MIFKDYYKILGLETKNVTPEQIKAAYREQAKKYHPDVNVGNKNAEERFKDINEAYNILSQPAAKKKYDRSWNNYVGKRKARAKARADKKNEKINAVGDFFSMFFGNIENMKIERNSTAQSEKYVPKQGENINTEIPISVYDAYYGTTKRVSLKSIDGKTKNYDVKIPSGIQNNEKIRLSGQGKPGENGGKPGDMVITVRIEDDKEFRLIGNNLYKDLYISPWEAVLGTRVNVETIDGNVKIIIPNGTQSGEKLYINGKGYKNSKGIRGDLVAEIKIMVPENLTEEEERLFRELSRVSKFSPRPLE